MRFQVPAETENGQPTTVTIQVENRVVAAMNAANVTGVFNEDVYCRTLTGFTKSSLEAAFQAVQNKEHWKNPIDAVVGNDDVNVTVEAIRFFHASEPLVISLGGNKTRIKGIGYAA